GPGSRGQWSGRKRISLPRGTDPLSPKRGAEPPMPDKDAIVRNTLALAGDDGRTPRETDFFFLGGNFIGLAAAARRAGYDTTITPAPDAGVVLKITTAVDKQSFTPHRKE